MAKTKKAAKKAATIKAVKAAAVKKVIVPKSEINKDECLLLVKAFRQTNKRAGEAKRGGAETNDDYMSYCAQLRDLAEKAEAKGFHIWVNENGVTGHTYGKDYKVTDDKVNDHNRFKKVLQQFLADKAEDQEGLLDFDAHELPFDPSNN